MEPSVATSQQDQKGEGNEALVEGNERVDTGIPDQEEPGENNDIEIQPDTDGGEGERELLPDREGAKKAGGAKSDRQEDNAPERQEEQEQELGSNLEEQIPGQDNILNHPEYLPPEMQRREEPQDEPEQHDVEVVENATPTVAEYMKEAGYLSDRVFQTLFYWNGESISTERIELVKEHLEQLLTICSQLLDKSAAT